uniref:Uncharacterized protein n=1 Tax=Ditylenchus dipsaci TaxID=166011 RepID=A0A915EI47_9BILA
MFVQPTFAKLPPPSFYEVHDFPDEPVYFVDTPPKDRTKGVHFEHNYDGWPMFYSAIEHAGEWGEAPQVMYMEGTVLENRLISNWIGLTFHLSPNFEGNQEKSGTATLHTNWNRYFVFCFNYNPGYPQNCDQRAQLESYLKNGKEHFTIANGNAPSSEYVYPSNGKFKIDLKFGRPMVLASVSSIYSPNSEIAVEISGDDVPRMYWRWEIVNGLVCDSRKNNLEGIDVPPLEMSVMLGWKYSTTNENGTNQINGKSGNEVISEGQRKAANFEYKPNILGVSLGGLGGSFERSKDKSKSKGWTKESVKILKDSYTTEQSGAYTSKRQIPCIYNRFLAMLQFTLHVDFAVIALGMFKPFDLEMTREIYEQQGDSIPNATLVLLKDTEPSESYKSSTKIQPSTEENIQETTGTEPNYAISPAAFSFFVLLCSLFATHGLKNYFK